HLDGLIVISTMIIIGGTMRNDRGTSDWKRRHCRADAHGSLTSCHFRRTTRVHLAPAVGFAGGAADRSAARAGGFAVNARLASAVGRISRTAGRSAARAG